jgi:hypothetical protein
VATRARVATVRLVENRRRDDALWRGFLSAWTAGYSLRFVYFQLFTKSRSGFSVPQRNILMPSCPTWCLVIGTIRGASYLRRSRQNLSPSALLAGTRSYLHQNLKMPKSFFSFLFSLGRRRLQPVDHAFSHTINVSTFPLLVPIYQYFSYLSFLLSIQNAPQ